jgi:hypothetical protein
MVGGETSLFFPLVDMNVGEPYGRPVRRQSGTDHWRCERTGAHGGSDVCPRRCLDCAERYAGRRRMQTQHIVTRNGGEALFVAADVASEASAKNMVKAALKRYGRRCCRGCRTRRSASERRRKGGFREIAFFARGYRTRGQTGLTSRALLYCTGTCRFDATR